MWPTWRTHTEKIIVWLVDTVENSCDQSGTHTEENTTNNSVAHSLILHGGGFFLMANSLLFRWVTTRNIWRATSTLYLLRLFLSKGDNRQFNQRPHSLDGDNVGENNEFRAFFLWVVVYFGVRFTGELYIHGGKSAFVYSSISLFCRVL